MVERQQIETTTGESIEPPGWEGLASKDAQAVQQIGGLPGDPPRLRALSPEESAAAPPRTEDDAFVRDKRGVAHAIREAAIIRLGYLTGNRQSVMQFRTLADAAGKVFRRLPPDVLSVLPPTLAEIPKKQWMVDRRYVFGEVAEGPRPAWMGRGWRGGMAQYEKGVIVDWPEASTGSQDGSELWLLVLHRLGWLVNLGCLVTARRYFWHGNHTVAYEVVHSEHSAAGHASFEAAIEEVPKHRFYSVFGEGRIEHTDVCWISKWALDEILSLAVPAIGTSEQLKRHVQRVEASKTTKAKGVELEHLMRLLFGSVDGLHVRGSNVRTKTEEIDLILDNKCTYHPWDKESPILLVECKNWNKPAGKNEIALFESKIKSRRGRCTIGFFIAWAGFRRTVEKHLLRSSHDSWMIVLLDGAQIKGAIETGGFTQLLDSAWYGALKM